MSQGAKATSRRKDKAKDMVLARSLQKESALPTPWLWSSETDVGLVTQDCERVRLCCCKPLGLWKCVPAIGNEHSSCSVLFCFLLSSPVYVIDVFRYVCILGKYVM